MGGQAPGPASTNDNLVFCRQKAVCFEHGGGFSIKNPVKAWKTWKGGHGRGCRPSAGVMRRARRDERLQSICDWARWGSFEKHAKREAAMAALANVVTSASGQTIEILNTDAEGTACTCGSSLVCAESSWGLSLLITLATLTRRGFWVALGKENAGLFSNDDYPPARGAADAAGVDVLVFARSGADKRA